MLAKFWRVFLELELANDSLLTLFRLLGIAGFLALLASDFDDVILRHELVREKLLNV